MKTKFTARQAEALRIIRAQDGTRRDSAVLRRALGRNAMQTVRSLITLGLVEYTGAEIVNGKTRYGKWILTPKGRVEA